MIANHHIFDGSTHIESKDFNIGTRGKDKVISFLVNGYGYIVEYQDDLIIVFSAIKNYKLNVIVVYLDWYCLVTFGNGNKRYFATIQEFYTFGEESNLNFIALCLAQSITYR